MYLIWFQPVFKRCIRNKTIAAFLLVWCHQKESADKKTNKEKQMFKILTSQKSDQHQLTGRSMWLLWYRVTPKAPQRRKLKRLPIQPSVDHSLAAFEETVLYCTAGREDFTPVAKMNSNFEYHKCAPAAEERRKFRPCCSSTLWCCLIREG